MDDFVIGVLGGMGTYATINLFKQYAEIFPAIKEWERPRIIIDNRCTMPSRVRAFLYGENVDKLVKEMSESINNLIASGCNRIILACNTSHIFLPEIYKKVPEAEEKIINIVDNCVDILVNDNIKEVFLLASEGTIESQIYQNALAKNNINCIIPSKNEYALLRDCIESVKQNKYFDEIKKIFLRLINKYSTCILGCTELPILYQIYQSEITCNNVYDPLKLGLEKIKKEYSNE